MSTVKQDDTASGPRDKPERSRVTINDIARMANVSKKTVSRVINESPLVREETREKIKQIIAETGFAPDPQARALAMRRSFFVAMVYDNPSPQYVVNMQRGILDTLNDTSFQLVLIPIERGDQSYRQRVEDFVTQHRPAGLILTPSVSEDEVLAERLREMECDYVRIASVEVDEPQRMVRSVDRDGAAQAARHLASLGHTRVAHIHGPVSFRSTHERRSGFEEGLSRAGLELKPDMAVEGAYNFDSGASAMEKLLCGKVRPTAVFVGNDEMAMGAYIAVRRAGLSIPQDISIVGYDDTPMAARVWPPMTSVRHPIRNMGAAAARLLLRTIGGGPVGDVQEFTPEIVVRESTAPPPA